MEKYLENKAIAEATITRSNFSCEWCLEIHFVRTNGSVYRDRRQEKHFYCNHFSEPNRWFLHSLHKYLSRKTSGNSKFIFLCRSVWLSTFTKMIWENVFRQDVSTIVLMVNRKQNMNTKRCSFQMSLPNVEMADYYTRINTVHCLHKNQCPTFDCVQTIIFTQILPVKGEEYEMSLKGVWFF